MPLVYTYRLIPKSFLILFLYWLVAVLSIWLIHVFCAIQWYKWYNLSVSNSSLSLGLINHRDISVISKRGYLTVNRRTGIMIDLGVAVFVQTVWFALLSLRVALERLH